MTTDIFVKSYEKDADWLELCMRGIAKFASGFRRVVLVVPPDMELPFPAPDPNTVTVIRAPELQPGYLGQQVRKHHADLYTDADYILHLDSDNILTQPITPESMMRDGKPVWLMTPWANVAPDAEKAWKPILRAFFGMDSPNEWMRQHPFLIPRWLYSELRVWCIGRHLMALEDYVMSRPHHGWSEFNAFGFHLYIHHRDKIHWIDTTKESFPQYVRQFYSYGGITSVIRSEIEGILNAPTPKVSKAK